MKFQMSLYVCKLRQVSMAHVKPLERKRGLQGESAKPTRSLPAWLFDASGSLSPLASSPSTSSDLSLIGKTRNPFMNAKQEENSLVAMGKLNLGSKSKCMTADSFKREWRRLGTKFEEKLLFLLALSPSEMPNIFKIELPSSILSDVVEVLCWWKASLVHGRAHASVLLTSNSDAEGMQTSGMGDVSAGEECPLLPAFDADRAFQMLKSLCACGRFSLSLKLAGTRTLSLVKQLIDKLVECAEKYELPCQRNSMSCVCSGMEHDANVGYVSENFKASETELFKGQAISLDELKHLANVYLSA
ncbi:hypothetical protein L7F22_006573 [Adiantum nelumboides]|nr:hypothetical protein [Adiantum nelumboides]MCO5553052.1 hypothetical protein [Adiantum nelumboides]